VITAEEGLFYRRGPCAQVRLAPQPQAPHEEVLEVVVKEPVESDACVMPAPLAEAEQALARGDYRHVVEMTQTRLEEPAAAVLYVRALANGAPEEAERACAQVTATHPLSAELHYLHAILLWGAGRHDAAVQALRRVLYLDRTLAIAQFTLGCILRDIGDVHAAARAFRNVRDLCRARPTDELVPLADGERAGRLAEIAQREFQALIPE
jgi:chemotaxis protein methyltransferase CheR